MNETAKQEVPNYDISFVNGYCNDILVSKKSDNKKTGFVFNWYNILKGKDCVRYLDEESLRYYLTVSLYSGFYLRLPKKEGVIEKFCNIYSFFLQSTQECIEDKLSSHEFVEPTNKVFCNDRILYSDNSSSLKIRNNKLYYYEENKVPKELPKGLIKIITTFPITEFDRNYFYNVIVTYESKLVDVLEQTLK